LEGFVKNAHEIVDNNKIPTGMTVLNGVPVISLTPRSAFGS